MGDPLMNTSAATQSHPDWSRPTAATHAHHSSKAHPLSNAFDALVGVVIISNAIVIGISSDIKWDGKPFGGWEILEYVFTAFFVFEMVWKMLKFGVREYFFGQYEKFWN